MKSILKSFKPKTVVNILNGDATLFVNKDVRLYKATKKLIEEQGYATFFMYCTKDKTPLFKYIPLEDAPDMWDIDLPQNKKEYSDDVLLNSKVVAKFTLRKVEEIEIGTKFNKFENDYCTFYASVDEMTLLRKTCLFAPDILHYAGYYDDYTRPYKSKIYAYHIEDLVIFNRPKELSEFKRASCKGCFAENTNYCDEKYCRITKAPQNFCYVESEE